MILARLNFMPKLILLILVIIILIFIFRNRMSIRTIWKNMPSWFRRSMKTSLYFVLFLFAIALLLSFFNMINSKFSCSSCIMFGLCSGGSSLGACFSLPMLIFLFLAIPMAIAGAIVGVIADLIIRYREKRKQV